MQPTFTHDCVQCVFLDNFKHDGAEEYDLYVCKQFDDGSCPTVIARYGNEPGDYLSGLGDSAIFNKAYVLHEAFKRAYQQGYLTIIWNKK